jgi:hypothetical protein
MKYKRTVLVWMSFSVEGVATMALGGSCSAARWDDQSREPRVETLDQAPKLGLLGGRPGHPTLEILVSPRHKPAESLSLESPAQFGEPCLKPGDKLPARSRLADLCTGSLGVNLARFATFTVRNIGAKSTEDSFTADVFINGVRQETVQFDPLAASSRRTVESTVARFTDCQRGTVRLLLDPQTLVTESNKFNNDYSVERVPPCPDVTAIIDQDRMNNNLQYKVQIRVVNNGTARMPSVDASIIAAVRDPIFGGPRLEQCETAPTSARVTGCMSHTRRIATLDPGELEKFTFGLKILASKSVDVRVTLKCVVGNDCLESNAANNLVRRVLGPH